MEENIAGLENRSPDKDEYITKQDLLAIEGISYGRLYRWKRMGLIPREWFIKKSAPTGQQTVLPRKKRLDRIEKIRSLMQSMPLDQVAVRLSGDRRQRGISFRGLYRLPGLDIQYANAVGNYFKKESYSARELLMIICCAKVSDSEKFTVRQYVDLLRYRFPLAGRITGLGVKCVIFAAGGDYHISLCDAGARCLFDRGLRVAGEYGFEEMWEELRDLAARADREATSTSAATNIPRLEDI